MHDQNEKDAVREMCILIVNWCVLSADRYDEGFSSRAKDFCHVLRHWLLIIDWTCTS
jgi:hypothetical protein